MARYKHIDTSPRFIAVDLQRQLLPGTIEHALNYLLDHQIDLTGLDARFCNDATGAAAYHWGIPIDDSKIFSKPETDSMPLSNKLKVVCFLMRIFLQEPIVQESRSYRNRLF